MRVPATQRILIPLLVLTLLTAGCLGTSPEEEPLEPAALETDELPAGIPSPEELEQRSIEQAPEWRLGEWWTFEVDAILTGEVYEATVVVAGARDGEILLGMPEESFDDRAMVVHFPPTGPVQREDLAWYFHSDPFPMAPFPLEPGKTWSFEWVGAEANAEVVAVTEKTAEIDVLQPNAHLMLTYDAEMGFISEMTWEGLASYRITDHGFGYEGKVIVPDDPTLAIFEGRLAGAVDLTAVPMPGPPVMDVDVAEGRDSMSLGFILGELVTDGTGAYRAVATAPDGTSYEETLLPTDGPSAAVRATHVEDPAGTWNLEFEAAGSGGVLVEAVAYNALRFELGSPG